MNSTLNIEDLEAFGVQTVNTSYADASVASMLNAELGEAFLEKYRLNIGAPTMKAAASLFIKQYARMVLEATLHSLGTSNCAFSLPLKECHFSKERKLCIRKDACMFQQWQSQEREIWRERLLTEVFAEHLTPVIEGVREIASVHINILWENAAVRINSFYRKMMKAEIEKQQKEQLIHDFRFLKHTDGKIFGLSGNPIRLFLQESPKQLESPIRKTCCLYYRVNNKQGEASYCNNCLIRYKMQKQKKCE